MGMIWNLIGDLSFIIFSLLFWTSVIVNAFRTAKLRVLFGVIIPLFLLQLPEGARTIAIIGLVLWTSILAGLHAEEKNRAKKEALLEKAFENIRNNKSNTY